MHLFYLYCAQWNVIHTEKLNLFPVQKTLHQNQRKINPKIQVIILHPLAHIPTPPHIANKFP